MRTQHRNAICTSSSSGTEQSHQCETFVDKWTVMGTNDPILKSNTVVTRNVARDRLGLRHGLQSCGRTVTNVDTPSTPVIYPQRRELLSNTHTRQAVESAAPLTISSVAKLRSAKRLRPTSAADDTPGGWCFLTNFLTSRIFTESSKNNLCHSGNMARGFLRPIRQEATIARISSKKTSRLEPIHHYLLWGLGAVLAIAMLAACGGNAVGGSSPGDDGSASTDAGDPDTPDGTLNPSEFAKSVSVTITSPEPQSVFPVGSEVTFKGFVSLKETPLSGVKVSWDLSDNKTFGVGQTDPRGHTEATLTDLAAGIQTIQLTARFSDEATSDATITVRGVGIPSAPVVKITPTTPTAVSGLSAEIIEASVADGANEILYDFQWYRNGTAIPTGIYSVLGPGNAFRDDRVSVTVTPRAHGIFGPAGQDSVLIGNTPPVMKGAAILPKSGSTLTSFECVGEAWGDVDGDTPQDTVNWERNGATVTGVESHFLPSHIAIRGDVIRCGITPSDGTDIGETRWSSEVEIGNAPPAAQIATLSPTDGGVVSVFVCNVDNVDDADNDPVSLEYQWLKNGASVDVAKATVAGVLFTKGDKITCGVTPYDGFDFGDTIWSQDVNVANSPPTGAQPQISPAEPTAALPLTCNASPAVDPDGDNAVYLTSWYINEQLVSGQTTPVLPIGSHKRGDLVTCGATPTDGETTGTEWLSAAVTVTNAPPTVNGAAIEPPQPTIEDTLTCVVSDGTDVDGDVINLGFTWTINGTTVLGAIESQLAKGYKKGDKVMCAATPHDGTTAGSSVSSQPIVIGNAKPTGGITTIEPPKADVTSNLACKVTGASDPDGDPLSYDIIWWVNGIPTGNADTNSLSAPYFASGDVVRCGAVATDGELSGTQIISTEIIIENAPPTGGMATIQPSEPTTVDELLCNVSSVTDPDGDDVTWAFEWIKNGEKIPGATEQILPPGNVGKGDIVVCLAVPSDGFAIGSVVISKSIAVKNSHPTGGATLLSPSSASVTDTLVCQGAGSVDADLDALTYIFGWSVNGVPIVDASGAKLKAPVFKKGDIVQCWSAATDGVAQGPISESNELLVGNATPDVPVVSLSPTNPTVDSELHCVASGGVDPDGDPVSYAYSWSVDDVLLAQETGQFLSGGNASKGQAIRCYVTASDGVGISNTAPSNIVVIGNASPEGGKTIVTPPNPTVLSSLTCVGSEAIDPDGDMVAWTYAWLVNGTQTTTGPSLSGSSLAKGDNVVCVGIPTDGISQGLPVSSPPIVVNNAAPSSGTVVITPSVATVNSTLSCTTTNFVDSDGDPLTTTITWYVNGAVFASPSGKTLTAPAFQKNDSVQCSAKVSDGITESSTVDSTPVLIGNAPPTAANVTLSPADATVTTTLICNASGSSDPDLDTVTYEYAWKVGGLIVPGKAGNTLTAPHFGSGDVIICSARPTDGELVGPWIASSAVVIKNAPPTGGDIELGPSDATEGDTLECNVSNAIDPDGDPITYIIEWWVNGKIVPVSGSNLDGKWFDAGDSVVCIATPTDGSNSGIPIETETPIEIQNTKPAIAGVNLTPIEGNKHAAFLCEPTGWNDPDNDVPLYLYSWTINNNPQPNTSTATFASPALAPGDLLQCTVVPFDGTDQGVAVPSNTSIIINNPPSVTSVSILPNKPTTVSTLECVPTGWVDVDLESPDYLYQWLVNGVELTDATSKFLSAGTVPKGATVVCVVVPNDGYDVGEPVSSPPVVIGNAPPTIDSVKLTPTYGNQSTLFSCTALAPADPDGDVITLTYAWYVNGKKYFGATESTLKGVQFSGLSELTCEITPKDSQNAGLSVLSNPAELWNTPPSIVNVLLTPEEPTTTDTLTCEVSGWSDAQGDPQKVVYAWLKNGVQIPGLVASSLSASATLKNQTWQCQGTPFDGLVYGVPKLSAPATIQNTAPQIANVTVGPVGANALTPLSCTSSGWVDPDNDPQQYTYTWLKNGQLIGGETSPTLPSGNVKMGDEVQCTVAPYDGDMFGVTVQSANTLVILNAPPQIQINSPSSLQYGTGDTILFSASVQDSEDNPEAIFVEWKSNLIGASLYEAFASQDGLSEFSDDLLGIGQHIIQVTATDSLGAKTTISVPLVIGLVCGSTGNLFPGQPTTLWTAGDFETGTLHPWTYANYRFLTTNGGMLDTDVCDLDEYAIGSFGAKEGNYGLTLSPTSDEFLLIKDFGTSVNKASVEGWVWLAGGFGLKFGFVSSPIPGKPGAFATSGFANTISATTTYVYSGTSTSSKNNAGAPGVWAKVRFSRDVPNGTFSYYLNDVLQFTVTGIAQPNVTGFAIGAYDSTSNLVEAKIDSVSYVIEPK